MGDHQMMSNRDRLVYMADQIASNFVALGQDHAVAALTDHIKSYWDPRMKTQICEIAATAPDSLSDTVLAAVKRLGS